MDALRRACFDERRDLGRFGVIVRHRELGYRANGMVVWDAARTTVVGRSAGAQAGRSCPLSRSATGARGGCRLTGRTISSA